MTPPGVTRVDVETAQQMYDAAMNYAKNSDIFIGCAAVADYRPERYQESKLKKTDSSQLQLKLTINKDIISAVAALQNGPFMVGFAAETDNAEQYAKDKLVTKKLDMIAANTVGNGLGFAVDDNALALFWQTGSKALAKAPKNHLARNLMTIIIEQYYAKNTTENS
jgi:phosphopantothenoylcysteine decarboxylase/phosphopantothenate--cysteine ligase